MLRCVNGLRNIIKASTCFKGQPTLIDLIITNKPKRFLPGILCIDTGLSDFHKIICVGTKLHVPKKEFTTITFRSYKHFNQNDYLQDLSKYAPFHVSEIFYGVDDSYWYWSTLLNEVVNEHAPIKGNRLAYMNGELRRAINVKHMLKRKFETCNSQTNWETYRKQRNLVTKLLKKSIQTYMQKRCREGNPQRRILEYSKTTYI